MRVSRTGGLAFILAVISLAAAGLGLVTAPNVQVLDKVSSLFNGELSVLDYNGSRYLLAQSRQGLMLQSSINLHDKENIPVDYLQLMALMTALHPAPKAVFNMGLGGGALARFHLQHYPESRIASAEIDPTVIQIAQKYFFVTDPRHKILEGQGFDLLKRDPAKYDIIWVDMHSPKEGPKSFIEGDQLNILRDHLNGDGMIVANLAESRKGAAFLLADQGYKRDYAHGIRVKSPVPSMKETMRTLRSLVSLPPAEKVPSLMPTYLVAVGNRDGISCANFWALYRKWTEQRLVSLKWSVPAPETSKEVCQDL